MSPRLTRKSFLSLALACLVVGGAQAQDLPAPTGDAILTVSGEIGRSNTPEGAAFSLADLDAMPQAAFTTHTIWTEGEKRFSGVKLADLLAVVQPQAGSLRLIALNDYQVEVALNDPLMRHALLATRINDKTMSVREQGPVWVIFPFDSSADLRTEVAYARSIWQLNRMVVFSE